MRNPPVNKLLRIVIPYVKVMKGFEHYEIIDRGGEEFMPTLIVLTFPGGEQETYYSENVIDRLP